ncbi:MAG: ribbon-helix-helix protein, CopG family [Verrucomicrobia bacterium]|nr:ribbon-helix-helix protein, CopG family [Verrucomicrobiota bacterium]
MLDAREAFHPQAVQFSLETGLVWLAVPGYFAAMTTLSLKLPDQLAEELAAAAAKRRVSKAALAREMLKSSLSPALSKRSAYTAMKDACGVVADAPADLSWNKRHLTRYGRG